MNVALLSCLSFLQTSLDIFFILDFSNIQVPIFIQVYSPDCLPQLVTFMSF